MCVFVTSASDDLRISLHSNIQRHVLQTMRKSSPHTITGLLTARRGRQVYLVYVYSYS